MHDCAMLIFSYELVHMWEERNVITVMTFLHLNPHQRNESLEKVLQQMYAAVTVTSGAW